MWSGYHVNVIMLFTNKKNSKHLETISHQSLATTFRRRSTISRMFQTCWWTRYKSPIPNNRISLIELLKHYIINSGLMDLSFRGGLLSWTYWVYWLYTPMSGWWNSVKLHWQHHSCCFYTSIFDHVCLRKPKFLWKKYGTTSPLKICQHLRCGWGALLVEGKMAHGAARPSCWQNRN